MDLYRTTRTTQEIEIEADEFIKWIESEEKKQGRLFSGAPAQSESKDAQKRAKELEFKQQQEAELAKQQKLQEILRQKQQQQHQQQEEELAKQQKLQELLRQKQQQQQDALKQQQEEEKAKQQKLQELLRQKQQQEIKQKQEEELAKQLKLQELLKQKQQQQQEENMRQEALALLALKRKNEELAEQVKQLEQAQAASKTRHSSYEPRAAKDSLKDSGSPRTGSPRKKLQPPAQQLSRSSGSEHKGSRDSHKADRKEKRRSTSVNAPDATSSPSSSHRHSESRDKDKERSDKSKRRDRSSSGTAIPEKKEPQVVVTSHIGSQPARSVDNLTPFIKMNNPTPPQSPAKKSGAVGFANGHDDSAPIHRPMKQAQPEPEKPKQDYSTRIENKGNKYGTVGLIQKNKLQGRINANGEEGKELGENYNEIVKDVKNVKQMQAMHQDISNTRDEEERRRKEMVLKVMAKK